MTRSRVLWLLGAGALALLIVLTLLDARMQDEGGPGIVGFEFAASEERTREILTDWGEEGRDAARLSLWLDFPYLVLYGAFLATAAAATRDLAQHRGWRRFARAGRPLVVLPLLGAACDVVENVGLLIALDERGGDWAPLLATIFASAKFLFVGVTSVYMVAALVRRATSGRSANRKR